MSIDFKIFAVCDHRIRREYLKIDPDLKTIRIPRLVSSISNIELFINGFLVSPTSQVNGFSIESDEFGVSDQKKKIIFKNKRKSKDDFFEVSYSVMPELCPKCTGSKLVNDESYNSLGVVNTVSNEEKLLQEVKKGLLTKLGSNAFHSWWGTKISQAVGSKVVNADSLRAYMIQEVTIFLDKYLDIQVQQSQYQSVTDREAYYQTLLIDAEPDPEDVTVWTLTVIFQNRTGNDMLFEKKFDSPLPVDSRRAITP